MSLARHVQMLCLFTAPSIAIGYNLTTDSFVFALALFIPEMSYNAKAIFSDRGSIISNRPLDLRHPTTRQVTVAELVGPAPPGIFFTYQSLGSMQSPNHIDPPTAHIGLQFRLFTIGLYESTRMVHDN